MRSCVVLNIAGLTASMVGDQTPNLMRLANRGKLLPLHTVTPAVTCTAQTTFLTGLPPRDHGIVANGWYFRDLNEIWFWRQSNRLVAGERLWEAGSKRSPDFSCANLFWWYNMASSVDIGVTPRPMYPADGRKIPDCYAFPPGLREELTNLLGPFPLFHFWGPMTSITSSAWITKCALHVRKTRNPSLTLVYLPHLDYNLQRLGPTHPGIATDLSEVDNMCGELIDQAERDDANIVVLSEYGITPVSNPIHINRALRQAGLIVVREELDRELLDPGASAAFAISDHQVAHVYVDRREQIPELKSLLESLPGVERVLDEDTKAEVALDHPRSGELIALADANSWFTYYYWLDDEKCPDFARTVDIHRKPGFDPVELFLDPGLAVPKLHVAWRLLRNRLGFRTLMDLIPLDAKLVKGSHGRPTNNPDEGPLFITTCPELLSDDGAIEATSVKDLILDHVFKM